MTGRDGGLATGLDRGSAVAAPPLGAVTAQRLWRGLPGLLGANLLFLAWCAPFGLLALLGLPLLALAALPLTVGPGLVALMAAAGRVAGYAPAVGWAAHVRSVRAGFGAGCALVAVLLVAWHAQLVALRAVVDHGATPGALALWAAELAVLAIGVPVGVHALALVGLHGQGVLRAARNGFVLAVRHPGPTVTMLGLIGAGAGLTWALAGAPVVIVPAVLAFLIAGTTQRLVDEGGSGS